MNEEKLRQALIELPIPAIRYLETTTSTNDIAQTWAENGAADMSVILADRQTAGRGRLNRQWITNPESALAFSIVIRPDNKIKPQTIQLFSPLSAVAVSQALKKRLNIQAQIKWPNDILIERQKVCGILTEANWADNELSYIIVGIGINIFKSSLPADEDLKFPATCLEMACDLSIDRVELLHDILEALIYWRTKMETTDFLQVWENQLAFKGEWVRVLHTNHNETIQGKLIGITPNGNLRLQTDANHETIINSGDVHLRPINENSSANLEVIHV